MTPITKEDIQQLASQSHYLGTGDPHRVKAVLKQCTSKDMLPYLQQHRDKTVFYFLLDLQIVAEIGKPFIAHADLIRSFIDHGNGSFSTDFSTVFMLDTSSYVSDKNSETLHFTINRIVDLFQISITSLSDPDNNGLNAYFPEYSILYYELTKF